MKWGKKVKPVKVTSKKVKPVKVTSKKVKPVKVTSKKVVTKKRTKQEEAPTRTEPGRRTRSTGPSAKSKERS